MRPDLMIIDDAEDQIALMRAVFGMIDQSVNIISATDGDDAIAMLRSCGQPKPKVILLDLRMPKKDGLEILSELKADAELKLIPVCIYSNAEHQSDVQNSYAQNASFYFRKPSGIEELTDFAKHFKGLWFTFASLSE